MEKAQEYKILQNYWGNDWTNKMLGDFKSYIFLRDEHTFQQIQDELLLHYWKN